ncbi:MAG: cell wall-binding repeat-containing protein, partial [Actinomycetota bacterium]|nr:cell wall-binding repeat-containing protein [Actinomycetota bacterium]
SGTSFELDPAQTHAVTFWSVDNVGNVEIARTEILQPAPESSILARISGKDRYETAAAISRATFAADTTEHVVLATGATFADALAANGLAGALDAPVLLTPSADLPPAVIGELNRLGARDVTVVGGASAVSDNVVSTLAGLGYTVSRIAGSDRYETAAMIAGQLAEVTGIVPERAFVVRGDSFADALSAAPYAYSQRIPVLLTRPDALSAATLQAIQATGLRSVTVVGGTSAVGPAVVRELEAAGITVERISGDSRYATAGALLEYAINAAWTTPEAVGVASGANFPDALGGGAAMGALHGALILTEPATLGSASTQALTRCAPTANDVRVFGGIAAVTPAVMDSIAGAFAQ